MRVAIVAAVVALGLRLVVLFAVPEVPVAGDALFYDDTARQLAGVLQDPPYGGFYRGFGYPLFLAAIFWITTEYAVTRIVQALLWAVAIGLAVAIAERLFGRRVAVVAAVLALAQVVALPHFLFLLTENLLVVELLAATAVLVFVRPSRPQLAAVAYGALLGAVALTHLGWQLFPVLGLLLLWSRREIMLGATACAAVVLAVLGPLHVIYPNQPWVASSGYGGYGSAWTFYVGTKTETDGLPTAADHRAAEQRLHEDSYYWREGIENIVDAPVGSAALWVRKQWRLWGAVGAPPTTSSSLDRVVSDVGTLVNALVLAAAIAGLAACALARRLRTALTLALPPLYAALVFPTFSGSGARYGLAPGLLLVIPAAWALSSAASLLRDRRRTASAPNENARPAGATIRETAVTSRPGRKAAGS
jgi:hypothetical protein